MAKKEREVVSGSVAFGCTNWLACMLCIDWIKHRIDLLSMKYQTESQMCRQFNIPFSFAPTNQSFSGRFSSFAFTVDLFCRFLCRMFQCWKFSLSFGAPSILQDAGLAA